MRDVWEAMCKVHRISTIGTWLTARTSGSCSANRSSITRLPFSAAVARTSCAAITGMLKSQVLQARVRACCMSAHQSVFMNACTQRDQLQQVTME